jgi:hypothetical protein
MAKRKTIVEDEIPEEPQKGPGNDGSDELASLMGKGFVRVSYIRSNGEKEIMGRIDREELSEDLLIIPRRWGGGTYYLEIFNEKKRWESKQLVKFSEEEYGPHHGAHMDTAPAPVMPPEFRYDENSPVLNPQTPSEGSQPMSMVDRMMAMQDKNHAMQLEAMRGQTQMLIEVMKSNAPQKGAFSDVVETARLMLEGKKGPDIKDQLDSLDTVLEISEKLKGGSVSGEGLSFMERALLPIVQSLTPLLTTLARKAQTTANAPRPVVQPKPAGNAVVPATAPILNPDGIENPVGEEVVDEVPKESPIVTKVKSHPLYALCAPKLLEWAQMNTTPVQTVTLIEESVPPMFYNMVDQLVVRPDLVEYLSVYEPAITQHGEWLKAVAEAWKAKYPVEDEGEDAPA